MEKEMKKYNGNVDPEEDEELDEEDLEGLN
jgi:hypothetical protein